MSYSSSNGTDVSTLHFDTISLQTRDCIDTSTKFIGFDLSTQQLKAIVIDEKLTVCHQVSVKFDDELSEYKTKNGVHRSDDGSETVTAPVNMWLKALDFCFEKLKVEGLDFSTVLGISGCTQQHGSVWWRRESSQLLANLNPEEYLHTELISAFSLRESPIWMDSSTSEECKQIEEYVGGPLKLAEITGSRAYERFTGPQIARIYKQRREAYLVTERITLISNFLASVMCGWYAPIDVCDASGMNMMDIRTKRWSEECLEAIFNGDKSEVSKLKAKLGCLDSLMNDNIVETHEVIGRVSRYLVERYGFPVECLVSSFTGEYAGLFAGLCVGPTELVINLGTNDTALFSLEQPQPGLNWHILRNPIDEHRYMGLVNFKNGFKTRLRIIERCAKGNYDEFTSLLNLTPRANNGNIGFYYDMREIYPSAKGQFRFNGSDERVDAFPDEVEARACIEGQVMRLLHHSRSLGFDVDKISRIIVTGGASVNKSILQVIADFFNSPVYVTETFGNSASLGAAYLASYAYELEQQKIDQSFDLSTGLTTPETSSEGMHSASNESVEGHCKSDEKSNLTQHTQNHFNGFILGSNESEKRNLVKVADPTATESDVNNYKALLERYIKLETDIAIGDGCVERG